MRATTIRFSDPIYERLDRASKYSGLPINAIVTAACMEWLRVQFPESLDSSPVSVPPATASVERLFGEAERERLPRLSPDAREVLVRARAEAERFRHNYIGTEHLLAGIAAADGTIGAVALKQLDIDLQGVRGAIEFIIGRAARSATDDLGLARRARKVVEHAADEASRRGDTEIDTAHLLLGLCDEEDGMALRIIESLGGSAEAVREAVEGLLA